MKCEQLHGVASATGSRRTQWRSGEAGSGNLRSHSPGRHGATFVLFADRRCGRSPSGRSYFSSTGLDERRGRWHGVASAKEPSPHARFLGNKNQTNWLEAATGSRRTQRRSGEAGKAAASQPQSKTTWVYVRAFRGKSAWTKAPIRRQQVIKSENRWRYYICPSNFFAPGGIPADAWAARMILRNTASGGDEIS